MLSPRSAMLLAILACACAPAPAAAQTLRNMQLMSHRDDYTFTVGIGNRYSSCWSYVHGDGREYAVIGTAQGTAIYNVTDPGNAYSVGFIQGPNSTWREMKSYREWIYVVSEGAGPLEGMQIISMANPESPAHVGTYTATFRLCHTVTVDTTRALLFANGTRSYAGPGMYPDAGTRILSLADPANPVEVGQYGNGGYPGSYVHDSFASGNRLYASAIYAPMVRVIDTSNPAAPTVIHEWTYPGAFTHNSWTDTSGTVLYVTDEINGEPLKIFDIGDVMNPVLAGAITCNPRAIVHNAHVLGDELYLANYTEGIRALDISDPLHPAEFGYADSYPGPSGGYFGVWAVCPYFPSGTVIASDMQTGLYVYRPVRDYGIVRVRVLDAATQQPLPDAEVFISSPGDSLITPADGIVQFGPGPGTHTVLARRFGWTSAAAEVAVAIGARDTVTLELQPRAKVTITGTVRDAMSLAPLEEADVALLYTPLHFHGTDAAGAFTLADVPDDIYRLAARHPGHVTTWSNRRIGPGFADPVTVDLPPAPLHDALEVASGWTVGAAGDDASAGLWVRVEPLGTSVSPAPQARARAAGEAARAVDGDAVRPGPRPLHEEPAAPPGQVQPEHDRTSGAGQLCFVTGQGTNPGAINEADVDNGRTSLTSPALDLSGMADPHVGWWQWFYSGGDGMDWLAVRVSHDNGATWTDVDTLRGPALTPEWTERTIRVADYVTPTSQVKLRFVAADLGGGSTVEAAIDDLIAWDAATLAADVPAPAQGAALRFRAPRPNPAAGAVALTLELPGAAAVEVAIFDVAGRTVRTLHRGMTPAGPLALVWDGADAAGRRAPAGLYFARARAAGTSAQARLVRVE